MTRRTSPWYLWAMLVWDAGFAVYDACFHKVWFMAVQIIATRWILQSMAARYRLAHRIVKTRRKA